MMTPLKRWVAVPTVAMFVAAAQLYPQTNIAAAITNQAISPSRVLAGDGSAAAPSYSFATQTNKGFYHDGNNAIGLALAGVQYAYLTPGVFNFATSLAFGASAQSPDTYLTRVGAKTVGLGPTTGVSLRWATSGLLEVRTLADDAYADARAATVRADTAFNINGTAGCTGTPTVVTGGIATTCVEPGAIDALMTEVAALRAEIEALRRRQ